MQTMYRLKANLDETRLALEARNNSLEKLQQSLLEKEQVCKYNDSCHICCLMVTKGRFTWSIFFKKKKIRVTGHIVEILRILSWF
jgi:ferredoxin